MTPEGATGAVEGRSVWELIEARASATPDLVMAVDEERRSLTFAGYRDAAERAAAGLAALGVAEGTNVSWELPTWLESLVLVGALARVGAVQNPILPIYRQREVGFITRQTRARLLVVPSVWKGFDYRAMAEEIASGQDGLAVLAVERGEGLPEGDASSLAPPSPWPPPDDPGAMPVRWLFYTSGTTADPKGAQHTDRTIMAAADGMNQALRLSVSDRSALVFPFTHIGGIIWLLSSLLTGTREIAVEAFDPGPTIEVLAREGVTLAGAGTPFHLAYLAAQRARRDAGDDTPLFPEVRAFPGGAAPKPPQLHYDVKAELGGVGIVSGYGLTECPILAMNTVRDPDEKLALTEGRATPGVRIRVVTLEGKPAGPGEEGELRVQGRQLFRGYVDSTLDEEAFDQEGWLRTGDLGHLDAEGFVTITGRLKDVIIRKGENISAKEIEDLLYLHPKVADAAVIGLPDPALGERCCAVVACKDPAQPLLFEEMIDFLAEQQLITRKRPERLEIVDSVPRNPSGKILKHKLRERFAVTT
ncbi:MAG: AMP-binding protein [Acidimicrobiales bacterium]